LTFYHGGESITLAEYFKKVYGPKIVLKDLEQILFKTKCELYLPPELCIVDGVPDQIRSNHDLMRDVLKNARKDP
jgi:hypothetical protein